MSTWPSHDAKAKTKGHPAVKKDKSPEVSPSEPRAKGTEERAESSSIKEVPKGADTSLEVETPAQPVSPEPESKSMPDVPMERPAGSGPSPDEVALVRPEETFTAKETPVQSLPKWVQDLIEAMRDKQNWDYVLLVNRSSRSNGGSSWPTDIKMGTTLKARVQVNEASEFVEFSCQAADDHTACFISEEVIQSK